MNLSGEIAQAERLLDEMNSLLENALMSDDVSGVARREKQLYFWPYGLDPLAQFLAAHLGHDHVCYNKIDVPIFTFKQ